MKIYGLRVNGGVYPLGISGLQETGVIGVSQRKVEDSHVLQGTLEIGDCNEEGGSSKPKEAG